MYSYLGKFEYEVESEGKQKHHFELGLDWEDEVKVSIVTNDDKPIEFKFDQKQARKMAKNIMSIKPVFILTKTNSLLRSTIGIQYNKINYVILGTLCVILAHNFGF